VPAATGDEVEKNCLINQNHFIKKAMQSLKPIYIVDDDGVFTFILRALLQSLPFHGPVHNFLNGAEGMKQLDKLSITEGAVWPLLILLDINMPIMNGWEFLSLYERMPFAGKVPVYVLSSSVSEPEMARSKDFSAVAGHYIKPVNAQDLREMVAPWLSA
jgi:CheY-like chemotaxis protein